MGGQSDETARLRRLALVGHDIRSVLADILGGLDLIDDSRLDPPSAIQLERVRASGESLGRLIDDAVEALTGEPSPTPWASTAREDDATLVLADLVGDIERRWRGHAAAMGLSLTTRLAPDLPPAIRTAPTQLERLVSNLLDNALKYASSGTIALSVSRDPDDALRLTVEDEGPGFSDESLARLFGYRGRPAGSAQPGTGLGLYIAKSLSDLMGGRLEAGNRSAAGGARVTFVLPRAAWHPGADPAEPRGALPNLSGRRALVADDVYTSRTILARMLGRLGAEVDVVGDGAAALAALDRGAHDLAVLDIHMPELSGIEVISGVRALPGPRGRVPILAVTAYVLKEERDAIYAAGADGLIVKPVTSLSALGEAIARLDAAPAAGARPSDGGTAMAADPQDATAAPRLPHLLQLAGPEGAAELRGRLVDDLASAAAALGSTAQARDAAGLRGATHVLISLTGAVGAVSLQQALERTNAAAHRGAWHEIDNTLAGAGPGLDALRREIADAPLPRAAVAGGEA